MNCMNQDHNKKIGKIKFQWGYIKFYLNSLKN